MKENEAFHILVIDDEKFNLKLASTYLEEEGYKTSSALSAQEAITIITKEPIDLILLDISMPEMDGFTFAKNLKSQKNTKDIPIIFLTAHTEIDYIAKAFEVGGVDYISKPFQAVELKARVKIQLITLSAFAEIKEKQERLVQLSISDPLTKLYNSLYFESRVKKFQLEKKNFWVLYFKLENFERINQMYGYNGSNKILKLFAATLQQIAHKNSKSIVTSRLYGTSFILLTPNYKQVQIDAMCKEVHQKLKQNEQLHNLLSVKSVLYNVDPDVEIQLLYKQLSKKMEEIEDTPVNIVYI